MTTDDEQPPPPPVYTVAKRPCSTCPYACATPPGIWAESEYVKLPAYDGETWEQPIGLFMCHSGDAETDLCAGWLACHDQDHSLALRLHAADVEHLLPYSTDVELYESGAAAQEGGMVGYDWPDAETMAAQLKVVQRQRRRAT